MSAIPRRDPEELVDLLVVDDRPEDLLAAEAVFDNPRYALTTASSGADALRKLLQRDYAVIVLDVRLPDMDGFELAKLIRGRDRSAHTPILFVTGEAADIAEIYRGYAVGAVDYLVKPVSADILRAKVSVFVALFDKDRRIREQTEALLVAERERRSLELARIQLESGRRYRGLADAIPHLVWTTNSAGTTTYLNRRWAEITGLVFSPGVSWLDALVGDGGIRCAERLACATEPFEIECRVRCSDGLSKWHLCRAVPERAPDGEILGWVGTLTDIEDLRWARLRDRAARRRSEFLAEATASLSRSLEWKRGLREMCALATGAVCDAAVVAIAVDSRFEVIAGGADPDTLEAAWRTYGGSCDHAELIPDVAASRFAPTVAGAELRNAVVAPIISGTPIRGTVALLSRSSYDLDDLAMVGELGSRIAAAVERAVLYEQAKHAIQARDEFLSIASHELRTPLSALLVQLGSVGRTLEDTPGGVDRASKARGKVAAALRHTNRLTGLVDSLLDVSRLATQRLQIRVEPCDLAEIAREVVERFADQARRAGCELKLDVTAAPGRWDKIRVEQVVTNLVSNAIKYGAGGTIELGVRGEHGARLVVRDHGIGIAEQDRVRIFDRFERAAPTRNYGGLGLGLYITREIVEAHGGAIYVESEPGSGTTFTVTLPETSPGGLP